jgi:hypothetical protein
MSYAAWREIHNSQKRYITGAALLLKPKEGQRNTTSNFELQATDMEEPSEASPTDCSLSWSPCSTAVNSTTQRDALTDNDLESTLHFLAPITNNLG